VERAQMLMIDAHWPNFPAPIDRTCLLSRHPDTFVTWIIA
jgi:hypothetical protein